MGGAKLDLLDADGVHHRQPVNRLGRMGHVDLPVAVFEVGLSGSGRNDDSRKAHLLHDVRKCSSMVNMKAGTHQHTLSLESRRTV